ncbi:UNVERIFIED_CONTAM: pimeloyl-ACP methyl ester carboxylesterase [Williamsia faeni]
MATLEGMARDLGSSHHPVTDWSDERRKEALRSTRLGHNWIHFGGLRRSLVRIGFALVAVMILCSQYWAHDVGPERERLATTQPQIHHIYDATDPANRDTAVVDLVGLGNLNASRTARSLPALSGIGQVWAVQYDNDGIDTAVISRIITTYAQSLGIDQIVLIGHSMGGIIALEVATHIVENTDVRLRAVILDCTPMNLHAVRAHSRSAGEDLLRWMGWLPGARESRGLRLFVETAARKNRFVLTDDEAHPVLDPGAFVTTVRGVLRQKIFNPNSASNGLIQSQFRTIVASGATDDLAAIDDAADDRPFPAIVFMRPDFGTDDPVVDVDYSQELLFEETGGPKGRLFVVRMTSTGHANPMQQPEAYNAAIHNEVAPYLQQLEIEESGTAAAGAAIQASAPPG